MANIVGIQVLEDGPRNAVVKVDILLDSSNLSSTTVIDPNITLSPSAPEVRIDKIRYDVEDALVVSLFWDASTPVRTWQMAGRGVVKAREFGGLINNAGSGRTGKITMTTLGWTLGAVLSASFILELVKMGELNSLGLLTDPDALQLFTDGATIEEILID